MFGVGGVWFLGGIVLLVWMALVCEPLRGPIPARAVYPGEGRNAAGWVTTTAVLSGDERLD